MLGKHEFSVRESNRASVIRRYARRRWSGASPVSRDTGPFIAKRETAMQLRQRYLILGLACGVAGRSSSPSRHRPRRIATMPVLPPCVPRARCAAAVPTPRSAGRSTPVTAPTPGIATTAGASTSTSVPDRPGRPGGGGGATAAAAAVSVEAEPLSTSLIRARSLTCLNLVGVIVAGMIAGRNAFRYRGNRRRRSAELHGRRPGRRHVRRVCRDVDLPVHPSGRERLLHRPQRQVQG